MEEADRMGFVGETLCLRLVDGGTSPLEAPEANGCLVSDFLAEDGADSEYSAL